MYEKFIKLTDKSLWVNGIFAFIVFHSLYILLTKFWFPREELSEIERKNKFLAENEYTMTKSTQKHNRLSLEFCTKQSTSELIR